MHGANGTAAIQSELRPCGNRTMKPHELTLLGHTHTQKLARSIMTFSRIYLQDLHTLSKDKKALKNPYRSHPARVFGGAKGIRTPDLYNANVARYHLCYSPVSG